MRLLPIAPPTLLLTACAASGPTDGTASLQRCDVAECFMQREIREFEVLDDETIVVYTGAQRCAFLVELRGFDCRMSFAPTVSFVQTPPGTLSPARVGGDPLRRDAASDYRAPERVCAYTRGLVVHTGPFDALTRGPVSGVEAALGETCDVMDIRSVTDDELVELYVNRNLAPPPPPAGGGELEVVEEEPGGDSASDEDAAGEGGAAEGGAAEDLPRTDESAAAGDEAGGDAPATAGAAREAGAGGGGDG